MSRQKLGDLVPQLVEVMDKREGRLVHRWRVYGQMPETIAGSTARPRWRSPTVSTTGTASLWGAYFSQYSSGALATVQPWPGAVGITPLRPVRTA